MLSILLVSCLGRLEYHAYDLANCNTTGFASWNCCNIESCSFLRKICIIGLIWEALEVYVILVGGIEKLKITLYLSHLHPSFPALSPVI